MDRVGQLKAAFLVQHHGRDRGNRLGHRVDPPQGVRLHRQAGLDVALPVAGHVRELAVPGDRDQPARQLLLVDIAREVPADPVEALGVETNLCRLDFCLQSAHVALSLRYFALSKFQPDPANTGRARSRPGPDLAPGRLAIGGVAETGGDRRGGGQQLRAQ